LFRFDAPAETAVAGFLRSFASAYQVEDRGDFFVFRPISGPEFVFDCEVVPDGLLTNRSGEYYHFLGEFLEALTGHFGKVEVEDA
jgi:hypothetical protein